MSEQLKRKPDICNFFSSPCSRF